MSEKELTWKRKGVGLKRTWEHFGDKGKYRIRRELLDGFHIYLTEIEHNNPYCIRFPISGSLEDAKEMVERYERNS